MALINFLKFSSDCGAVISDEEFWNVYFRKRMHGDNLYSLLDEKTSRLLEMNVVYGAVGYPSLHHEVIEDSRKRIMTILAEGQKSRLLRVKDIARISFDSMQNAIRRRINQKMNFYYGFNTDDLNRGYYVRDGQKITIETEVIKSEARKLAERNKQDQLLKVVLQSKAAIFGYDKEGITGYHLAPDQSIVGYIHEGFEAIGAGKYASGLVFGSSFKARTLKMRQNGYSLEEGMLELIDSAFTAGEHFKEVGGNYNIVLLDRSKKTFSGQYREFFDDSARLAVEIVKAYRAELLGRPDALKLLEMIFAKEQDAADVEKHFFTSVSDISALHFLLRKYKLEEVRELANMKTQTFGNPAESGKRGKK